MEQFGKGAEHDEQYWNSVIRNAMMIGLIDKDIEKYGTLKLNEKTRKFVAKPFTIEVALNHNFDDESLTAWWKKLQKLVLRPILRYSIS
jgi:ATP-dependent DNA helicase RecQ